MRRIVLDDIREISQSPVLRGYGCALALVQVLTFIFFTAHKVVPRMLTQRSDVICWPYFEDCTAAGAFWTERLAWILLYTYLAFAVLSAITFLIARATALGYALLITANLVMLFIMVQDYRLMGNYHYMPYFSTFAFLFLPAKRDLTRVLVVAFYVGAGALKFHPEWLSGLGMIRTPVVEGKLLEILCAYVVIFETIIVFGLLSRRRWIFWTSFGHCAVFHIFSWHIVGFFYPCVMACLLSVFVLDRRHPEAVPDERLFSMRRLRPSSVTFLGLFALGQIAPYFFPGDSAITGEGRLFALNMFDARALCENAFITHEGNTHVEVSRPTNPLGVRIRCDPIVYHTWAKNLCAENRHTAGFDFDLFLVSKRTTDAAYRPLIAIQGFCSQQIAYDIFRHNPWILP